MTEKYNNKLMNETDDRTIINTVQESADSSLNLAKLAIAAIEEKKGENIRLLDISKISVLADYFIIASGNNPNQLRAISDIIQEKLHKSGIAPERIEGYRGASWILLDYKDVVIHLFSKEDRAFYDIERIWNDALTVELA